MYYAREPWGEERADLRAAGIQRMILASTGAKRIPPLEDFMPKYERAAARQRASAPPDEDALMDKVERFENMLERWGA